jgi:hypothetical protein
MERARYISSKSGMYYYFQIALGEKWYGGIKETWEANFTDFVFLYCNYLSTKS